MYSRYPVASGLDLVECGYIFIKKIRQDRDNEIGTRKSFLFSNYNIIDNKRNVSLKLFVVFLENFRVGVGITFSLTCSATFPKLGSFPRVCQS